MPEQSRANQGPSGGLGALGHAGALPGGVDAQLALRAAHAGCTVLITGETGVGKGWLARWLHDHSPRAARPFVPVNCGAIPDAIIDSHLFGHARGSFTGATHEHDGMIRAAEGGTLLLDEVSELPPSAQVRLLRLLQDHEAQPVGYSRPVIVDVRVIASTNIDLHSATLASRFREDLLYRLDIVRLHVRPLRERAGELIALISTFNREFAGIYGREPLEFAADALACLRRFRWPGNVRQVRTVIERLHVLCPNGRITLDDVAQYGVLAENEQPASTISNMEHVRLDHVRRVVEQARGSISQAADNLGVHRSTLYRWLREHPDQT